MFEDGETKAYLLDIVDSLENEYEHDLSEGAIFRWTYPERPHVQFQLLIKELDESSTNETIH